MTELDFETMSRVELRDYLNSHRDDNRAWDALFAKVEQDRSSNPNQWYPAPLDEDTIRITEEAINQKIREIESKKKSA